MRACPEQAGEPDARAHGLDVRERLDAGGRVVVDQDILHGEAGAGEEIQMHGADVHRAVERRFERRLDAGAQPIGAQGREPAARRRARHQSDEKRAPEVLHGRSRGCG